MGKMTLQQMITQLAGGMAVSTQIFVITLLIFTSVRLVIAFGRMSKNKLIQTIVKVYISIMRGTPLMLQLMVVYFGPYYLFRIKVGSSYRLWATFIGFVINYAAYFARFTAAASSRCRSDSMRQRRFWVMERHRPSSRSSCRR